jgi:tRNA(Ile)-lysidine synthase
MAQASALERFRGDLEALGAGGSARLGIALSGGPDSVALLLLAAEARLGAVEAATVDHGLRPESAAEARFAGRLCQRLQVPHAILKPAAPIVGNLQSEARRVRYALLEDWRLYRGLDWLLTAHHADDQAETLLMRLNRGSGVAGLAAIRPKYGQVLRPLLSWRRSELAAIVATARIKPVADPSNADRRYDRVRMRHQLDEADWLDPDGLSRSAAALGEAEEALAWMVDKLVEHRLEQADGRTTIDVAGLPAELKRRLLFVALRSIAPEAEPRGEEIGRLLATLEASGAATLAGVKASGGDNWTFEPAPPRRF